jgi:hypothetical protein
MRICRWRGEWMVSRPAYRPHVEDAVARERPNRRRGCRFLAAAFFLFTRESCYSLEASSSPSSRLATSARSSSSGKAASFSRPAYKRSSWRSDIESRSTPPTRSSARGRCNQRSRISAARGSETARSLSPRSMSASVGGPSRRRLARPELVERDEAHMRGVPPFGGCSRVCPCTKTAVQGSYTPIDACLNQNP